MYPQYGIMNWDNAHRIIKNPDTLVKIISSAALEYAEGESKAFAEFIAKHEIKRVGHTDDEMRAGKWYILHTLDLSREYFPTTELYHSEEFKKFKEGK